MARPLRRGAALSTRRARLPRDVTDQQAPVNQVTETDAALTVARAKSTGQNSETDTANPKSRLKSRTLGLAW